MGTFICQPKNFTKIYIILLNIAFVLVASFYLAIQLRSSESAVFSGHRVSIESSEDDCKILQSLDDFKDKCLYLKSNNSCASVGYLNYLSFFYCNFARFPFLGYCLLFLWLLILLYLLGNTASEYFCSSLENISRLLNLSPIISGVTLLALGNGAPDVFASLVSIMGSGTDAIGFNTMIGGVSFVTSAVVGIISIMVRKKLDVTVNKFAFIRDVCFLLLVLASLVFIFLHGKINLQGALVFSSMYLVYVIIVYVSHVHWNNGGKENSAAHSPSECDSVAPILLSPQKSEKSSERDDVERGTERDANSSCESEADASSSSHSGSIAPILTSMERDQEMNFADESAVESGSGSGVEMKRSCYFVTTLSSFRNLLTILGMPLYLPRRLTIPAVSEDKWSKPYAVASVTLAPVLLSALWILQDENATFISSLVVFGIGFLFGIAFGVTAYLKTEESRPPQKCLFLWLAGGFMMSVTWSYVTAQELVSFLASLGYIFGISPSILGLTVLAWGNSLGDLVTNLTMALNGKPEGVQVAISACYAAPIFNLLVGLGLSLAGSAWHAHPTSIVITKDPYLLETIGFLVGGLVWALVVLPTRNMKLDGVLGGGLIAIYLISLSLRLIQTLGYLQFHNTHTFKQH